ncbi:MAG: amidohydrolase family protein, partial [Caldisericia bacterium]|nr:amidohydrolase family protein [Caldisericia bacterium]
DIRSLSTFKEALDELLNKYKRLGIIGIKLAHAYFRTLSTEYISEKDASVYFQKIVFKGDTTPEYIKLLQDHIIYFLGELALKYGLIFQIHTGLQDNWIKISYSDPLLLIDLIKDFPGVCFDLLHTGYPYSRNMGILAKHYPNVWVNMAWMFLVSLSASKQILSEYIDLVPAYRILAFGSDVDFPEMILGHLIMARNCIVDVLAEKVENNIISENLAFDLMKMMFRENALQLYSQNIELVSQPEHQDYHWLKVAGKHVKIE